MQHPVIRKTVTDIRNLLNRIDEDRLAPFPKRRRMIPPTNEQLRAHGEATRQRRAHDDTFDKRFPIPSEVILRKEEERPPTWNRFVEGERENICRGVDDFLVTTVDGRSDEGDAIDGKLWIPNSRVSMEIPIPWDGMHLRRCLTPITFRPENRPAAVAAKDHLDRPFLAKEGHNGAPAMIPEFAKP